MQDLLSILFYIRKSKAQDSELGTIYLRITYSGERAELSTFLKVSLENLLLLNQMEWVSLKSILIL